MMRARTRQHSLIIALASCAPSLCTLAGGCASNPARPVRTQTLANGAVVRSYSDGYGTIALPAVPVADATHEWTIPRMPGAERLLVEVRPLRGGVPVEMSKADSRPPRELRVVGTVSDAKSGTVLIDTRDASPTEDLWHAMRVGHGRNGEFSGYWWNSSMPHVVDPRGSTMWRLEVRVLDPEIVSQYCDQLEFRIYALPPWDGSMD